MPSTVISKYVLALGYDGSEFKKGYAAADKDMEELAEKQARMSRKSVRNGRKAATEKAKAEKKSARALKRKLDAMRKEAQFLRANLALRKKYDQAVALGVPKSDLRSMNPNMSFKHVESMKAAEAKLAQVLYAKQKEMNAAKEREAALNKKNLELEKRRTAEKRMQHMKARENLQLLRQQSRELEIARQKARDLVSSFRNVKSGSSGFVKDLLTAHFVMYQIESTLYRIGASITSASEKIFDLSGAEARLQGIFQSMAGDMKMSSESMTEDAKKFLYDITAETGTQLDKATRDYGKILFATRTKIIDGQTDIGEVQGVFAAFQKLAAVHKLTREEQERLNLALTQTYQKGKLTGEEVNRQMGQIVPMGGIIQKAMNLADGEMEDMMRKGELLAYDTWPKVVEEINKYVKGLTEGKTIADFQRKNLVGAYAQVTESIEKQVANIGKDVEAPWIETLNIFEEIVDNSEYLNDAFGAWVGGSLQRGNSILSNIRDYFVEMQKVHEKMSEEELMARSKEIASTLDHAVRVLTNLKDVAVQFYQTLKPIINGFIDVYQYARKSLNEVGITDKELAKVLGTVLAISTAWKIMGKLPVFDVLKGLITKGATKGMEGLLTNFYKKSMSINAATVIVNGKVAGAGDVGGTSRKSGKAAKAGKAATALAGGAKGSLLAAAGMTALTGIGSLAIGGESFLRDAGVIKDEDVDPRYATSLDKALSGFLPTPDKGYIKPDGMVGQKQPERMGSLDTLFESLKSGFLDHDPMAKARYSEMLASKGYAVGAKSTGNGSSQNITKKVMVEGEVALVGTGTVDDEQIRRVVEDLQSSDNYINFMEN